jgi:hypothetical protein
MLLVSVPLCVCVCFLDAFSLCAIVCLCVFCIGILAPLRVVFCE